MSGTHEHLEHAEHVSHRAGLPFDRKVAVSMAIVAASLAGVSMLGHRAHNNTLRHQTEAGHLKVQESNAWAQYQAKRVRQHVDESTWRLIQLSPSSDDLKGPRADASQSLRKNIERYAGELIELKEKAEGIAKEAKDAEHESHLSHDRANWLDLAHLALELGLVLCSIALLTKKPEYWISGLLSAGLGLGLVAAAYTVVH